MTTNTNTCQNKWFVIFIALQECPEGIVHEDCFKDIYAKFFPHGSKCITKCAIIHIRKLQFKLIFFIYFSPSVHVNYLDSSIYAHYVFKAFDVNSNGAISFRVSEQHTFVTFHFLVIVVASFSSSCSFFFWLVTIQFNLSLFDLKHFLSSCVGFFFVFFKFEFAGFTRDIVNTFTWFGIRTATLDI